ncbi:hypothetical protein OIO90_004846 [Microbotryomycetes sp. JL221]|nr:hypothetical protein OIO90_004846 [Microbotryomycetes sp. JL221]
MDDAVGWIVAIGFVYVAYRILFGTSSSSSTRTSQTSRSTVPQSSVDQVTNMFPNIPQSNVRFALEQARGNVQSVVERALTTGTLPDPPAGFFQPPPITTSSPTPPRPRTPLSTTTTSVTNGTSTTPTSLIAKLGLQDRISNESTTSSIETKGKMRAESNQDDLIAQQLNQQQKQQHANDLNLSKSTTTGWQTTSQAREQSLKERKAKMVLEARRRMLEKQSTSKNG